MKWSMDQAKHHWGDKMRELMIIFVCVWSFEWNCTTLKFWDAFMEQIDFSNDQQAYEPQLPTESVDLCSLQSVIWRYHKWDMLSVGWRNLKFNLQVFDHWNYGTIHAEPVGMHGPIIVVHGGMHGLLLVHSGMRMASKRKKAAQICKRST